MRLALFLVVLMTACSDDPDAPTRLEKIRLVDGEFTTASGATFFPWGLNYTNAEDVGLLEDAWFDPVVWQTIQSDFIEMKDVGSNVVRIHLQYHRFMRDENTPSAAALDRLVELLVFAESIGLYIDVTGLAAYRTSDAPAWYDALSDEARWATHQVFWRSIATALRDQPAVFSYNLMNEPVVSVGCTETGECSWVPGEPFGGFHFIQNISRDPERSFEPTMREWIREMTNAIRSVDDTTVITVGFLNLGTVSRFAPDLDYISAHIYPRSGELAESIAFVVDNQSADPLVIEETGNLHCSIEELGEFLDGIDGRYDGLMGHYHGKTIDELDSSGTIPDALRKNFLEFFRERNPN